jgi:hypothetical protein
MDRLLFLTAILGLALIIVVLASVRRAHIRVEYSVSWLVAAAALLLLSQSNGLLERASSWLGIVYPPVVLLLILGCVFLFTLYRFSVIISHLRDDNIALAQKIAILEYRLDSVAAKE